MGLRVATNVESLKAQRSLGKTNERQATALNKLSTGERITKAGDDAAGLAISEKLKASIRGLGQAQRNANDGISLIQTAEGGMTEISNILVRLRELSVQSASDTIGDSEREFLNMEYGALKNEINRIAEVTNFNGTKLLSGVGQSLDFQVGINNDAFNDRISYNPEKTDVTAGKLQITDTNVSSKESAQNNLNSLDNAIQQVNGNRAVLGATQNRLMSTVNNLGVQVENLSTANSRIRDADIATETSELTKQSILSQAGVAVLSQANQQKMSALKLI